MTTSSRDLAAEVSPRILRAAAPLDGAARQFDEYFAGGRQELRLPVDLRLAHGFRRTVLLRLRAIGYGQTESYADDRQGNRQPARRDARWEAHARTILCRSWCRATGSFAAMASIGEYLGGTDSQVARC